MSREVAEALGFGLVVAVLAALVAWPVPIAPGSWWIGSSGNDHASIAFTLHWVADRLASGSLPFGWTDRLSYPHGATFWPADLPEAIALAPVTLLLGPVVALNLLVVAHHGLTAGATWGWLRARGATVPGAWVGGMVVALCPAIAVAHFDGNPDATPWYWLPLAMWAVERGRPGWAGACIVLGGACSPYVGVGAAIVVGAMLAFDRRWTELAWALGIGVAGGAVLIGIQSAALLASDAAVVKGPRPDGMGTAAVLGLLDPRPFVVGTDPWWSVPRVATGAYLGWAALSIAVLSRSRLGWTLVAVGAVLALGPELRLVDDPFAVPPPGPGTEIPLPGAVLAWVPGLGQMHQTARLTVVAAVGLAILASDVTDRLDRWGWAIPGLVILDLALLGGGVRALRPGPVFDDGACEALAELPPGPVFDVPTTYHELGLLAATCHGQPVAEGINRPPQLRAPPEFAAELLGNAGFRYLVVHRTLPHPDLADLTGRCLVHDSDALRIYDLSCDRSADGPGEQGR